MERTRSDASGTAWDGRKAVDEAEATKEKLTLVRVKRKRSVRPEDAIVVEEIGRTSHAREKRNRRDEDLVRDVERALKLVGWEGKETEDAKPVVRMMYRKVVTFEMPHLHESQAATRLLAKIEQRKNKRKEGRKSNVGSASVDRKDQLRHDKAEMERTVRYTHVQSRRKGDEHGRLDPLQDAFRIYDLLHVDGAAGEPRTHGSVGADAHESTADASHHDDEGRASNSAEEYVYDVYVADEDDDDDVHGSAPVVQVANDPELFYFGPETHDESYDSEDSNDENYVGNDYPDEPDSYAVVDGDEWTCGTSSDGSWSRSSDAHEDYL